MSVVWIKALFAAALGTALWATRGAVFVPLPPAPRVTAPTGTVTAGPVAIRGTGNPGGRVIVTLDGATVTEATVSPDGAWRTVPIELAPGDHRIGVADASAESSAVGVQCTVPLLLQSPVPGFVLERGTLTVKGRAAPGTTVKVSYDTSPLGETTVGRDGYWSVRAEVAPVREGELRVECSTGESTSLRLPGR